jgi:hypothetical protein
LGPDSVAITVGVGEDITFDSEVAWQSHAAIHLVDPSPRAIEYVARVKAAIKTKTEPNRTTDGQAVQDSIMQQIGNNHR